MTDKKWQSAHNPVPMLNALTERQHGRQLRLFALACCHRVRRFITDPRSEAALTFAERQVDRGVNGKSGRMAIKTAADAVYPDWDAERNRFMYTDPIRLLNALMAISGCLAVAELVRNGGEIDKARTVSEYAASGVCDEEMLRTYQGGPLDWKSSSMNRLMAPERADQADLLRDIVGNPFRPVPFDPAWRTSTVMALTEAIDAERAFDRLPILADALEEAGCDHPDVLAHCRGPGLHVRGCWVIDAVLGNA